MRILCPTYKISIEYHDRQVSVSLRRGNYPKPLQEYHGNELWPLLLEAVKFIEASEEEEVVTEKEEVQ